MKRLLICVLFLCTISACSNQAADESGVVLYPVNLKNMGVDILEEEFSSYEMKELTSFDFEIAYNDVMIKGDTIPELFLDDLGYPEDYFDNNQGNISNGNGYRRWQLVYPNSDEPDIRIILLSKQEIDEDGNEYHGDTYIVGIHLEKIATLRGLKVGDTLNEVLELYGKPSMVKSYDANVALTELSYQKDDKSIKIVLDENCEKVMFLFIDYKMEQASKDQKLE